MMRVHSIDYPNTSEVPEERAEAKLEAGSCAAPPQLPRSGKAIVWLFRLAGQSSGPGWLAWIYATVVYGMLTYASLSVAIQQGKAGMIRFNETQAFFTSAMESSLFGATHVLAWIPRTCTFFVGRRRYEVLLDSLKKCGEETQDFSSHGAYRRLLNRYLLMMVFGSFASSGILQVNYVFFLGVPSKCTESTQNCITTLARATIYTTIDCVMYLIVWKLQFAAMLIATGFQVVNSEIKAMISQGYIDSKKLKSLRKCQAKLSAIFSRTTQGMIPELFACMFYGMIAQVSSYLLIISAIKSHQGFEQASTILLRLWGALVTVTGPCEAGQMMLNQVSQTRDALLDLPPADLATNQEVAMFLEATRRDLDDLGDRSVYRRNLAIVSAQLGTSRIISTNLAPIPDLGGKSAPAPFPVMRIGGSDYGSGFRLHILPGTF